MDGTGHPARALSDGTLRFLALAVIELDPEAKGLLCLEEPENGIHPDRIPAMLELLQDIATDPYQAVGPDNPLRQVIINTHSPLVLGQVPDDSALFAQLREIISDGKRFKGARFSCLPNTWRAEKVVPPEKADVVSLGDVVRFLNPISPAEPPLAPIGAAQGRKLSGHQTRRGRRVVDRSDTEPWLIPDAAKKP
jgi:hypothetical protein